MVVFNGGQTAFGGEIDPALLAFVKCHVTSALKWDVMRLLADAPGGCMSAHDVAARLSRPEDAVCDALEGLAREGLVQTVAGPLRSLSLYRLDPLEPSSVVLRRLIQTSTRSQELRGIIAAHLLRTHALAKQVA